MSGITISSSENVTEEDILREGQQILRDFYHLIPQLNDPDHVKKYLIKFMRHIKISQSHIQWLSDIWYMKECFQLKHLKNTSK
jgi:hypothetical protein